MNGLERIGQDHHDACWVNVQKKTDFDEFLRLFARGFAPGLVQRSGVRGRDQGSGHRGPRGRGNKGTRLGWAGIDSEFRDPGRGNR